MSTTVTFLGHSALQVETASHLVLIDPFLTGNPAASCGPDDLEPHAIILTHGHADHVGDTVEIARRCGSLVIANFEIASWLGNQGVENTHAMHLGGSHRFDFGTVKLTLAHHGSALPDGSYGGNPAGVLLETDDGTIFHAGDTALFSDMQLIGESGIDVAILPIGDNFTMGPADALRAVQFLSPQRVVPCHYNTWPLIEQDAQAWGERVASSTPAEAVILEPGGSLVVSR